MQKKIYITLSVTAFLLYLFSILGFRFIVEAGWESIPLANLAVSIGMTLWGAVLVHHARARGEKVGGLIAGLCLSAIWIAVFGSAFLLWR